MWLCGSVAMGRKRNVDTGSKGADPTCPNGHTLRRRVADGDYECDACSVEVSSGCCFYGCEPCDYSLCGGCYVKLATGSLEEAPAPADAAAAAATGAAPDDGQPRLDPDVADLCEHYEIEDRIMYILNEVMKTRQDSFAGDIAGLWDALATARSPAGLLMAKIRHMKEGTFVGKVEPPPEVKKVIQKYRLDEDARTKLTDFICKRPQTAQQDLWEIERRLENSGRPSAVVMTMIVALQKGTKLPELRIAAPHRDYGEINRRARESAGKGEAPPAQVARSRREGEKGDRERSDKERDRRGGERRSRSRGKDRRSRSRERRSRSRR